MTKLVKYIGTANIKRVSTVDLAQAGISSPDLVFSQAQDFYMSVPDAIALFLLASGDFRAEDGSSMLDIFENNASPEASPEVLGIKLGSSGDILDGVVEIPSQGSSSVPALRALGTEAGEALPGNDERVAGAIQGSAVTGENKVFVRDQDGDVSGVELLDGHVLAGSEDGPSAISFAALEALIATGGIGLNLSDLSDVDLTADVDGYYLAATPGAAKPFSLRALPNAGSGESFGDGIARQGSSLFGGATSYDFSENYTSNIIVDLPDSTNPAIFFKVPQASTSPFRLTLRAPDPFSSYDFTWIVEDSEGGDAVFSPVVVSDTSDSDAPVHTYDFYPFLEDDGFDEGSEPDPIWSVSIWGGGGGSRSQDLAFALSDSLNPIEAGGEGIEVFRTVGAMTIEEVRLQAWSASLDGDVVVDISVDGVSIFEGSNRPTLVVGSKTSLDDPVELTVKEEFAIISDDTELSFDILDFGDGVVGLKVVIRGSRA